MVFRTILVFAALIFFIGAIGQLFDGHSQDAFESALFVLVCLGEARALPSRKKTPEQTPG